MPTRRWSCSTSPCCSRKAASELVDKIAVVSAPAEVQRARVLARPGMSDGEVRARSSRHQMPDEEKRARADFVIPTGGSLEETRQAVRRILACLAGRAHFIRRAMREIVFDTETTGPQPARRRPHGRDRLRRAGQPGRDRPHLPCLFQSRPVDAERRRGGARPHRPSSSPTSRLSPTRSRSCSNSSATVRWSRTMRASISASSTTSSTSAAGRSSA